jgi:hypothetical protein
MLENRNRNRISSAGTAEKMLENKVDLKREIVCIE